MSPSKSTSSRWQAQWNTELGHLLLFEPTPPEVAKQAPLLAAYYSDDHNRTMMANTGAMSAADTVAYFAEMSSHGHRLFLLYRDQRLVGDADLRRVAGTTAECAIMVGERAIQGRGLGTRFAVMLHALAFAALQLEQIYISVIPNNRGSLRLFEKLGYQIDNSPEARRYADIESDVTLSYRRADFERNFGAQSRDIVLRERGASDLGLPPSA